jgi:hypothetical protein
MGPYFGCQVIPRRFAFDIRFVTWAWGIVLSTGLYFLEYEMVFFYI